MCIEANFAEIWFSVVLHSSYSAVCNAEVEELTAVGRATNSYLEKKNGKTLMREPQEFAL